MTLTLAELAKGCFSRLKGEVQADLKLGNVPDVLAPYEGGLSVFGDSRLAPAEERTVLCMKAHFFELAASEDTYPISHAKTRDPIFSVQGKSPSEKYGGLKLTDRRIVKDMSGAVRRSGSSNCMLASTFV